MSAADGWLKLTLDTGDMSGTELLKVLDAYRQKKKYYRLKNGEFLKLSDDGFMTIARLQEGLGIGKGELKEKQIVLPSVPRRRWRYCPENCTSIRHRLLRKEPAQRF